MKLSSKEASPHHHVLLFGPPKSGKTKLTGNLATEGFNLHWFDLENGVGTLKQLSSESQERVNLFALPDTRSFPIAIETLLKVIKGGRFEICDEHGKVACALCKKALASFSVFDSSTLGPDDIMVVDSLTQLTASAIAHITKAQTEDYKMQTDDWGSLGKLMDVFHSHVQQAPFNLVCISHETEVEMEDGSNKLVPTAGSRNFSRNTAKFFDEVIYCQVVNKKHGAGSSTTFANKILTGSRSGIRLEDHKEGASLAPIFRGEVSTSSPATAGIKVPAVAAAEALAAMRLKLQQAQESKKP